MVLLWRQRGKVGGGCCCFSFLCRGTCFFFFFFFFSFFVLPPLLFLVFSSFVFFHPFCPLFFFYRFFCFSCSIFVFFFLLFISLVFFVPSSPPSEGVFIRGRRGESYFIPVQSWRKGRVVERPLGSRHRAVRKACPLYFFFWW